MVPKRNKHCRTQRKGSKTKNIAQLPPNLVASDGPVTDEEPDPTLRDVMSAIGTLTTWVAANEERLAGQTQQPVASSL